MILVLALCGETPKTHQGDVLNAVATHMIKLKKKIGNTNKGEKMTKTAVIKFALDGIIKEKCYDEYVAVGAKWSEISIAFVTYTPNAIKQDMFHHAKAIIEAIGEDDKYGKITVKESDMRLVTRDQTMWR